ncbi:MAG: glycosyltransferase family 4 protein, partial [Acidimicrobiales bacterium]
MKIAYVSEFVYPFHSGGAEKRFFEIASRLAASGHEVHWFGVKDWAGEDTIVSNGVFCHSASQPLNVYTNGGRRSIPAALGLGLKLARAVTRSSVDFDLIDCSLYPFFHIPGIRMMRRKSPMVVTWHEYWGRHWRSYLGPAGRAGEVFERLLLRSQTHLVAVSDMAKASLLAAGVATDRISLIYNGVDIDEIGSVGRSDSADGADIVYFGRLKAHKNVDVLLEAVALLTRSGEDIRCLVIGDGPERARLERNAKSLGLDRSVRFVGELERAEDIYGRVKAS